MKFRTLAALTLAATLSVPLAGAPIDGTFSYQGRLTNSGSAVTGLADLTFSLWDAGAAGAQIGADIVLLNVPVSDGLFNADLDFGVAALNGEMRWLEIEARSPAGAGGYTTLSPRQEILGAPYSVQTRGIFVDDALNVGIGTTAPASLLDVRDSATGQAFRYNPGGSLLADLRLFSHTGDLATYSVPFDGPSSSASQMVFVDGDGGFNAAIGAAAIEGDGFLNIYGEAGALNFQVRGNPDATEDGVSNTRMFIRSSGLGGVGGNISVRNNDNSETISLLGGTSGNTGMFSMFDATGAQILDFSSVPLSSQMKINNTNGNNLILATRDTSPGGGGFLGIARNDLGNPGFNVNGNWAGTESAHLQMFGTSPMAFNTSTTGSGTVQLPTDAIQDFEILDEPGVASATSNSTFSFIGPGNNSILARTITVPTSGWCFVIGTGQANISHTTGSFSTLVVGVSDVSGSLPANQDVAQQIHPSRPSGTYLEVVTVQGLFEVTAGSNTFYFVGSESNSSVTMNDMQLSVLFFPTAYGTVNPTVFARDAGADDANAIPMLPMTGIDIQNEQVQAAAFDQNRRAAEAADYAQMFAELEARLRAVEAQQGMNDVAPRRASPPIDESQTGAVLGHNTTNSR